MTTTPPATVGPVAASTGLVPVLYSTLSVSGAWDELPPVPPTDGLTTTGNCVHVHSAGYSHITTVTLQRWDHEPPPAAEGERWETFNTATLDLAGEVSGVTITDGEPEGPELDFPPGTYHLRAYARGRTRLRTLLDHDHPAGDEDQIRRQGIEEHLLQFWPA